MIPQPSEQLRTVKNDTIHWASSVMSHDYPGMFRMSADAFVPYDLQSTAKGLHVLDRISALEDAVPVESRAATVTYIQSLQDPETGFFRDPLFEEVFPRRDDPQELLKLRRANAKWGKLALNRLGSEPTYPFYSTGSGGEPEPDSVLAMIKNGDWSQPWGIGSHAAQAVRELFFLADNGREEYFPYVKEGMEIILSHQNPETGMWGGTDVPLHQAISGALKVIGCFQFSLGFTFPYLDKLADSCIRHHADRSFYAESGSHCIPRNAAEMAIVCLLHSDYRKQELLETIASIAEYYYETYHMPDGGFSASPGGTEAYGWNGTILSPVSETPRSSMSGTNGSGILGLIAEALGWDSLGIASTHPNWRKNVEALNHRVFLQDGRIVIERRHAAR